MHTYPKAVVAVAALGASIALATGPVTAVPTASSSHAYSSTAILAVDGDPAESDGNDDTGKWGLAGLLGLFGLFGYRKYRDARTSSTQTTSARPGA